MNKKLLVVLAALSVVLMVALVGVQVVPAVTGETWEDPITNTVKSWVDRGKDKVAEITGAKETATTEDAEVSEAATEEGETAEANEAAEADEAEVSAEAAPDDTEPVVTELDDIEESMEDSEDTEAVYVSTAGAKPEDAKDEDGWITDVTEEDVKEWNTALTALDRKSNIAIIEHYNEDVWHYEKWPDESYKIPFSWNSMTESDFQRQKSAMKMGLTEKEILDAMDFIFKNLSDEQIKKVVKLAFGKDADFSGAEVETLKEELFQTWLENPVVFRATLLIMQPLQVGDSDMGSKTISENCTGLRKYLEKYDEALDGGIGTMVFMRDANGRVGEDIPYDYDGELYVSQEHIVAVCQLISFYEAMEFKVGRYHTDDRMHMIALDYNHLRKGEEINNDEPLLDYWLYADYYLKGSSKRAWRIGFNLGDRSPAILKNTSSKPKPKVTSKIVTTVQQITQDIIWIPGVTTTGTSTTTYTPPGTTPDNPPGKPDNPPNQPDNPPDKPDKPGDDTEHKSPIEGSKSQDNADTGGGPKSDPGPGEYKQDQGNSQSSTVEGSQYQQGTTSTNTNNTQPSYDTGGAADNTDNGTPPETKPIEQHESHYESSDSGSSGSSDSGSSDSGGSSASAGSDNSKMSSAPPADDD